MGKRRAVDPDRLLEGLVNLASDEVRRLRSKHRARKKGAKVEACEHCGVVVGAELTEEERTFILRALREIRQTAFGAKKLLLSKLLKDATDGQLDAVEAELEKEGGEWLVKN